MLKNPYSLSLSRYSTHQQIINHIGKNRTVLDVGCNDGYIGRSSDKSNTFYGLDYSANAVGKAKKAYKDAIVYDLNELSLLPWSKKFDVIVMADVLEHLIDAQQCLHYFLDNYLKDGGLIIITLPNIANWRIRFRLLTGRFDYTETGILDKTHLHFYTYKSARELLNSAQLKIVKELGGATLLGPIIWRIPPLRQSLATGIVMIAKHNK